MQPAVFLSCPASKAITLSSMAHLIVDLLYLLCIRYKLNNAARERQKMLTFLLTNPLGRNKSFDVLGRKLLTPRYKIFGEKLIIIQSLNKFPAITEQNNSSPHSQKDRQWNSAWFKSWSSGL
jgi:hypothetical protein